MSVLTTIKGYSMKYLTMILVISAFLINEVQAGCGGCGPSRSS